MKEEETSKHNEQQVETEIYTIKKKKPKLISIYKSIELEDVEYYSKNKNLYENKDDTQKEPFIIFLNKNFIKDRVIEKKRSKTKTIMFTIAIIFFSLLCLAILYFILKKVLKL